MKRKYRFLVSVLVFLAIGYLGFLLFLRPCEESSVTVPMPIFSTQAFHIVTDQGPLYIGQTYRYQNEGPWIGNLTLLFASPKKAIFLIHYPVDYPDNNQKAICKGFYP
jgi:hypothetical protein